MTTTLPIDAALLRSQVHTHTDGTQIVPLRLDGPAGPPCHSFVVLASDGRVRDLLLRIPASALIDSASSGEEIGLLDRTPTDDEWRPLLAEAAKALASAEIAVLGRVAQALKTRLGNPDQTPTAAALQGLLISARSSIDEMLTREMRPDEATRVAEAVEAALEEALGDGDREHGPTVADAVAAIGSRLGEIVADAIADSLEPADLLSVAARKALHGIDESLIAAGHPAAAVRAAIRDIRREVIREVDRTGNAPGTEEERAAAWARIVEIASRHGIDVPD